MLLARVCAFTRDRARVFVQWGDFFALHDKVADLIGETGSRQEFGAKQENRSHHGSTSHHHFSIHNLICAFAVLFGAGQKCWAGSLNLNDIRNEGAHFRECVVNVKILINLILILVLQSCLGEKSGRSFS